MQDKYFTDEELTAFLDGETEFSPVADITRALETDADLAKRIEDLHIDRSAIRDSFAGLVPDAVTVPDFGELPDNSLRYGFGSLATAAGLALAIGLGAGAWMSTPAQPGWTDYVASYQALYSNATLAQVDQTDTAKQSQLDRVLASIDKSVDVSVFNQFPEAEYKRAQVLSFEGRALVQLAFTTSTGEPMALCIIRTGGTEETQMRLEEAEGLSSAHWAQNGYEYFLIGGQDDALVSQIGAKFVALDI